MKNRITKYSLALLIGVLLIWGGEEFFRRIIGGFAGSYPFVEHWEIDASEREVINAVKELHKKNINFQLPPNIEFISKRDTGYNWETYEMQEYLKKLKADSLTPLPKKDYSNCYTDYWLYINLYYPNTRELVHTWTRPSSDTTKTTFAFVSIGKIDVNTEPKLINRDFWYIENKRQINKFKKTFVDKINEQIEEKRKLKKPI